MVIRPLTGLWTISGFGFVEFESSRDAEDALHHFNGKSFMGTNIVVEFAKESRPRREVHDVDRAPRFRRPPGFRLVVSGISRDTSWQVGAHSITSPSRKMVYMSPRSRSRTRTCPQYGTIFICFAKYTIVLNLTNLIVPFT